MRKPHILFFVMSFYCHLSAQNLVPNPGFENYSICPDNYSEINYTDSWYGPPAQFNTPDYFNTCAPSGNVVSVPVNAIGYQLPHTGNAFAGIFASQPVFGFSNREYLRTRLVSPMVNGLTYWVQFYCNLADQSKFSVSTLGAYLSVTDTSPYIGGVLMLVAPQILTAAPLNDKQNWMLVRGKYVAMGNEQYITIGNFFPDTLSGISSIGSGTSDDSYYFIDDVCVSLDSSGCTNASGTPSLYNQQTLFSIAPNPACNKIIVTIQEIVGVENITISDIAGRIVEIKKFERPEQSFTGQCTLSVSNYSNGIYFVTLTNNEGKTSVQKLIVDR